MNEMPIALIVTSRIANLEARSALPGAPVVPHVERDVARVTVVHRTRKLLAVGLRRTADAVAPPRPVKRTPTPAGVCREAG